jgi:hypothetical protein
MNLSQKMLITGGLLILFAACKKDKPTTSNHISFKLNGVYKNLKPEGDLFDDGTLLLQAGPFMKDQITLFIDTAVLVKTYRFEDRRYQAEADYNDHSGVLFLSDTGKLVITSFDGNKISGSFEFKAKPLNGGPGLNITEGEFSAKLSHLSAGSPDTCSSWPDTCPVDSGYSVSPRQKLLQRHLQHARLVFRRAAR